MAQFYAEHADVASSENDNGFLQGYLECAEWLARANTDSGELTSDMRDALRGFTRDAIASARRDCKAFRKQAGALLQQYADATERNMGSAGHDFYLTRNRHGAGFWDRGAHPCLRELTDIAHGFGESDCEAYRNRLHLT